MEEISKNWFSLLTILTLGVGWIVTNWLSKRKEMKMKKYETELNHLRFQIEQYYAPIKGYRKQCKYVHKNYRLLMPTDNNEEIAIEKMKDHEIKIHDFLTEEYFIPLNARIAEIINTKAHLQDSIHLPESFEQFLEHQISFESAYNFKKINSEETDLNILKKFPGRFDDDVDKILTILKKKYHGEKFK